MWVCVCATSTIGTPAIKYANNTNYRLRHVFKEQKMNINWLNFKTKGLELVAPNVP